MSADTPDTESATPRFADLSLSAPLLRALADVGYESPSPIQAATIPPLLEGRDVLGQAQTGTGKTAAFALPVLSRIDPLATKPQALVLAPTRELAIQVAEAFQKYASHMPGFHVLPIYGGQSYGPQLGALKRGVQVVVGTPGRVIDHLERGSLDLSELRFAVLDEADEMLRMGFIDDVEKVLKATPATRQVALFSATMPAPIKRIAQTYLKDPVEVAIKAKTTTATNIRQRYWLVSGLHKLDAITRILEAETFDAMIVFARTKSSAEELADKLAARGFSAAAIHGDVQQAQRERTIQRLKDRQLDILVATDVAARGLDVERISHVLNYDIPYDTESYVHRIGRTGRAGRNGDAILFVTPRERGMLKAIEKATRQAIEPMTLPTVQAVNDARVNRFLGRIGDAMKQEGLGMFRELLERFEQENNVPAIEIAAGLAKLLHGDEPLLLEARSEPPAKSFEERPKRERAERTAAPYRGGDSNLRTFRIEVGHNHRVKPGNIVGAIANEAGLESKHIGRIEIGQSFTLIDLPADLPADLIDHLRSVWVAGQMLKLRQANDSDRDAAAQEASAPRPRAGKPFGKPGGKPPRTEFGGSPFAEGAPRRPASNKPYGKPAGDTPYGKPSGKAGKDGKPPHRSKPYTPRG